MTKYPQWTNVYDTYNHYFKKLGNDYLNGELLQHTFEAFEVRIN